MRKVVLFIASLIFAMATCSQSGGRTRDAFEVKHSIFFADGSLDEYTATKWDSGYTRVDNEVRYSASETMLEQIEYSYNDDKDGRKNMKVTLNAERQMKNKVIYQYDPQTGKLSREVLADSKGRPISIYLYSYDSRGNQISRTMNNRTGDKLAETTYTYDANGKMIMSETRDAGNNRISSTRYSYDGQGNLVNQQVFNGAGQVTSVISSVFQAGREIRNEIAAPDGSIQMRVTNEYGTTASELTRKTIENLKGASKQIIQYEYVFRPRR